MRISLKLENLVGWYRDPWFSRRFGVEGLRGVGLRTGFSEGLVGLKKV